MTELSRIRFGQPVGMCPEAGPAPADKWAILDALTHAAEDFGLNHRTLGVLRALLTFFPDRALPADRGAGVVYPSNRVLAERLNGMPESTLRRHLATLVRTGLVDRHDSANRKRFARFGGVAFGFDLSPLARYAEALQAAADRALARRAQADALRARIAATRQRLLEDGCDAADPLIEDARLCQRRKLPVEELEALAQALDNRLTTALPAAGMSASDSRNERHIQTTDQSESVSSVDIRDRDETPALSEVLDSCHEYQSFFPTRNPDWPTLVSVAERLHPMMGIDTHVFAEARQRMGAERATTVLLCMLETMDRIRKPGAYLRALCQRADRGLLNLGGMLKAASGARLSADNFG